jgi:oxepin-CoA hydrolase / 3-oxo-5,6-dehydrosuberyl-CoA semialdehyde dehydrogenase
MQLESYVQGAWRPGRNEGVAIVAWANSDGIDYGAVAHYARAVGGPQLRALTFHERAAILRTLGKHLLTLKDEFYDLSYRTGTTKMDAWPDIDGGIGTMLVFASKGGRELPNSRVLLDGPVEGLSKGGTFVGRHLWVPLEGVALHINAFNFPVWGMLEKLAPAFLAGVPVIVKPATATAFLTERVVRAIIASRMLPEGSLQLICGGVGNLFDYLDCQDVVSFTGSASTAQKLRTHPAVVRNAVRFVAETDSLNSSILGPDAAVGTPEFDLYVKEVVREMTAKAGQKCTAIRKAIVPRHVLADVSAALTAALKKVVVGHPREEGVRMGPLATLDQRREVLSAIARLRAETTMLLGDEKPASIVGARAARGESRAQRRSIRPGRYADVLPELERSG